MNPRKLLKLVKLLLISVNLSESCDRVEPTARGWAR